MVSTGGRFGCPFSFPGQGYQPNVEKMAGWENMAVCGSFFYRPVGKLIVLQDGFNTVGGILNKRARLRITRPFEDYQQYDCVPCNLWYFLLNWPS